MIKKFDEFINESLWKKGIERSKTGEIRLEDRTMVDDFMDYFKTIEWQDMACDILFAKYDFPKLLSFEDIIEIQNKLPKDVHITNRKELELITRTCTFKLSENNDGEPCIDAISGAYKNDEHFVSFNLYEDREQVHYYCNFTKKDEDNWYVRYGVIFPPNNQDHKPVGLHMSGVKFLSRTKTPDYKNLCIKLCKQK